MRSWIGIAGNLLALYFLFTFNWLGLLLLVLVFVGLGYSGVWRRLPK